MKDFFRKLFTEAPARANMTHGTLLLIIGGDFVYMGVQMIRNTQSGASSMPMNQSIALCAVMCVIGLLVAAYGGLILWHVWRKNNKDE